MELSINLSSINELNVEKNILIPETVSLKQHRKTSPVGKICSEQNLLSFSTWPADSQTDQGPKLFFAQRHETE